ncbi:MAG: response regulator [Ktedonobacteraceae bacterium]|nr:response regulator [Ktedonobacteraceae bacterium]
MSSILVVESEDFVASLLRRSAGIEGCRVVVIPNGKDAVRFALREMPSLIILDVTLPGINGAALIQRLREHPKSMHIPIITLGSSASLADRVRALELGVDSYLTKPINKDELLAHIRRQLLRVQQTSLSPLTRLPGGLQLERAIDYKLRSSELWSVLYLDLDYFKAFNDVYGFLAGNDMILLVGDICQRIVYEYGNTDDFVGHIGGDDFVIVTTPDREEVLCERILEIYKQESALLYREEHLARGTISAIDRRGRPYESPLVSISIGVVSGRRHISHNIDEIGTLAAEAKLRAKQSSCNVFYISSQKSPADYTPIPLTRAGFSLVGQGRHGFFQNIEKDALAEI